MKNPEFKRFVPNEHDILAYLGKEGRLAGLTKTEARRKLEEEINKLIAKIEASGKLTDEHRMGLGLPPKCWDSVASEEESPPKGL